MRADLRLLAWLARNGRWVLPAGLVVGVAVPPLAVAMAPLIVPLLAVLLLLGSLRIGPEALAVARARPGRSLAAAAAVQLVPALAAVGIFGVWGVSGHPLALGVVLVLAASPITGAAGLAVLAGGDPAPALRHLVLGTALLPLTALPVLALLPVFGDPGELAAAALRLTAVVVLAGAGALWLRRRFPALAEPQARVALDGLTALVMALVVVALTAALGPALVAAVTVGDTRLWVALGLAMALNFGTQLGVLAVLRGAGVAPAEAAGLAIVTGNRNLALMLAALPPATAAEVLLFVGAYQVPMFLTPLVLAPLYRRVVPDRGLGSG